MTSIKNEIVKACRQRLIIESTERIKQCLKELQQHEIWYSEHGNHNSIGNLILHLEGNVTQYILSGIGGQVDDRKRDLEFSSTPNLSSLELSNTLDQLMLEVSKVLDQIKEEDLLKSYHIQCFDMTTIDILIHVVEHFSYHTGQITYYTKRIKDIDTGFYKDLKL